MFHSEQKRRRRRLPNETYADKFPGTAKHGLYFFLPWPLGHGPFADPKEPCGCP